MRLRRASRLPGLCGCVALCFSISEMKAAGFQVLLLPRLDLRLEDGETKTHLAEQVRILRPREGGKL